MEKETKDKTNNEVKPNEKNTIKEFHYKDKYKNFNVLNIGEFITKIRKQKGLSQDDIAKALFIDKRKEYAVYRYKNDEACRHLHGIVDCSDFHPVRSHKGIGCMIEGHREKGVGIEHIAKYRRGCRGRPPFFQLS